MNDQELRDENMQFPVHFGELIDLKRFKTLTKLRRLRPVPRGEIWLLNKEETLDGWVFRMTNADSPARTLKVFKTYPEAKIETKDLTLLRELLGGEPTGFSVSCIEPGPYNRSWYVDNVYGDDLSTVINNTSIPLALRNEITAEFIENTQRLIELLRSRATGVEISWCPRGEPFSTIVQSDGVEVIVSPLIHYRYKGHKGFVGACQWNVIVDAYSRKMTIVDAC